MSDHLEKLREQLPESIKIDNEPVFSEPWQAQAFAMAVSLLQNKVFTWNEWAQTLGTEIAQAARRGIPEDGSAYYELWLAALEQLAQAKQLASAAELVQVSEAWRQAYANTPHGEPVVLELN